MATKKNSNKKYEILNENIQAMTGTLKKYMNKIIIKPSKQKKRNEWERKVI